MLEEILTKVGAAAAADYKRNVDPDAAPSIEIDEDAIDEEGDPPRIVFEPKAERWVGRHAASQDGKVQPRILYTRLAIVRAHVWGENRTRTEELLRALARQTYALLYGSFTPLAGEWVGASKTKLGHLYLLDMEIQIPVPRELDPTVQLTEMPITGVITGI